MKCEHGYGCATNREVSRGGEEAGGRNDATVSEFLKTGEQKGTRTSTSVLPGVVKVC